MKPYLVRLALEAPVAQNGRIALDGLLAAALFRITGDSAAVLPLARYDGLTVLPPGVLEPGQVHMGSILLRSAGHYIADQKHIRSVRPTLNFRHGDAHDDVWKERKGTRAAILIPDMQRGRYQNLMNSYRVAHAGYGLSDETHAVYFRFCGDARAVRDLLAELPGIGKKVSAGFGQIAYRDGKPAIDVFDVGGSLAGVVGVDGQPERAVPYEIWEKIVARGEASRDVAAEFCAIAVPYHRSPMVDCVVPNNDFGLVGRVKNPEGFDIATKSLRTSLSDWFGATGVTEFSSNATGLLGALAREDRV